MKSAAIKKEKQRIESLQVLRALAFLCIFSGHTVSVFFQDSGFVFLRLISCLGVSVFFVMSGFLMMYAYGEKSFNLSFRNNFAFAVNKIKKLYPLHIITMFCAVFLAVVVMLKHGVTGKSVVHLMGEMFLNITLLQTWVPYESINTSLNGVAWYLSVTVFLYFMFPYLKNAINKTRIKKLCFLCILFLMMETASCVFFIRLLGADSPIYIWFMYCFPVFRLADFFVGGVLAKMYAELKFENMSTSLATVFEIFAILATAMVFVWLGQEHSNIILKAFHNRTTLFIPLAAVWVYLFSSCKGLITKAFMNAFFIFIGNISPYAFLIHYVIAIYARPFLIRIDTGLSDILKVLIVFAELVCSIVLSVVYKHIHEHSAIL